MMNPDATIGKTAHPAPHRDRAPYAALAFILVAPPIAWALRLFINDTIARTCVGAGEGGPINGELTQQLGWILVVDLIALLIAASAAHVAYGLWTRTRDEKTGDVHHLVHRGEGRTRFLAVWGLFSAALLGLATAADAFGAIMGPTC
jgi:hypothetical protein